MDEETQRRVDEIDTKISELEFIGRQVHGLSLLGTEAKEGIATSIRKLRAQRFHLLNPTQQGDA